MAEVKLVSQAEFARLMGVSQAAVHHAIKQARITTVGKKIDPAVAQIQWAQNTRARAPSGNATGAQQEAKKDHTVGNGDSGYWESRAKREATEAAISELKLQEMQGALMRVDVIKAVVGNAYAATREAIMQIPSRLAAQLAAESNSSKVQSDLAAALHQALEALVGVSEKLSTSKIQDESAHG